VKAAAFLSPWHPFTQEALDPAPIKIERGEGAYLYTSDGRKLLDAISSWWVNLHGHGHPLIASAIAEQARKLEHVVFAGFTHEPAEELSRRLLRVLPPGLEHIFFSDDGSTAVEVALKMAVQYWQNIGQPGKNRASCEIDCLGPLARLLEEHHQQVAAVIAEPLLQGAGGMIVHPVEFLKGIRELTSKYGVLLIADEVLTGFGRCGRMFACELAGPPGKGGQGMTPDIMCLSKGLTGGFLPLAATVATRSIHESFCAPDRRRTFFHGHSYTANPLGCAAAIASLKIFDTEPVFERIAAIERVHRERAPALREHPAVGDVRMIGTVAAIELREDDPGYFSSVRPFLYDFYLRRGVLLRPLGNVVYILPPYVITAEELHGVYDVIAESLDRLPVPDRSRP
jgi:adenosylmethionine-8-amino-7-oxononanoate aminotransferase